MTESMKIDVTPMGMRTKEGEQRVGKALAQRNEADYECYRQLKELLNNLLDRKKVVNHILECNGFSKSNPEDVEWAEGVLNAAEAAIKARDVANENFLRAVAGRPSMEEEGVHLTGG
jgi:hypothetical protein